MSSNFMYCTTEYNFSTRDSIQFYNILRSLNTILYVYFAQSCPGDTPAHCNFVM
jgi:hypothetical protein